MFTKKVPIGRTTINTSKTVTDWGAICGAIIVVIIILMAAAA